MRPAAAVIASMLAFTNPRERRDRASGMAASMMKDRCSSKGFLNCYHEGRHSIPSISRVYSGGRNTVEENESPFNGSMSSTCASRNVDLEDLENANQMHQSTAPTSGSITCAQMVKMGSHIYNTEGNCSNGNHDTTSIPERCKETYKVFGWVKKITLNRDKTAAYVELIDGTSSVYTPLILRNSHKEYGRIHDIDVGDAVTAVGSLENKPVGKDKQVSQTRIVIEDEERGHSITLHQNERQKGTEAVAVNREYPLAYLREHCNLRARNSLVQAIFRIRSKVTENLFSIFSDMGFVHVTTPSLTGMNCEGMGEIFKVVPLQMDDAQQERETYLSVSGQLELEAMCSGISRVWKLGPAFRADRSDTPRHLSEFWMLEAEMNDVTLRELIEQVQCIVKRSAEAIISQCEGDLETLQLYSEDNIREHLNIVKNMEMDIISYEQAIDMLNNAKKEDPNCEHGMINLGEPLTAAHERSLIKIIKQPLVAVTNYPENIMPFYMESGDNGTVNNVDILAAGVGEVAGGSLREVRYDLLKKKMDDRCIDGVDYEQYIELRKFGNAPHGGFGIGLERMIMFLLRVQNIRDVIHFPKLRKKYTVE